MSTDLSCTTLPEPEQIIKRFRRGDTRDDGKMFWAYKKGYGSKELWFTPEKFFEERARTNQYERFRIKSPEALERALRRNRAWKAANVQRSTRRANARRKERRQTDPAFALASRFRVNLHLCLNRRNLTKRSKCSAILGITWREFREYIESQFSPGMSWDNRSEWHIDHIVPLAVGKTEQDVIDLNHYTNLRPLWKNHNLEKSDTLPPASDFPPHLRRFLPEFEA